MQRLFGYSFVLFFLATACREAATPIQPLQLDALGIAVPADQPRDFSYTDKKSAYFYGNTHAKPGRAYFAGWNIGRRRIFADYTLFVDGRSLNRAGADVTVYPHQVVRRFDRAQETLRLFDGVEMLQINLENIQGSTIGIRIASDITAIDTLTDDGLYLIPQDSMQSRLLVAPQKKQPLTFEEGVLSCPAGAGGFVLIHSANGFRAEEELVIYRREAENWQSTRDQRMQDLLDQTVLRSTNQRLEQALAWARLTLDQLIMDQQGRGIYAGLPWFNDYWGRDIFISLPGACLVSGQFETAREILTDFGDLQNFDYGSPVYGRIPNRARPESLIYNTTDGTPRFVIQTVNYAQYAGDRVIIDDLYPHAYRSIDGSLTHWVDEQGYLTHDDADTWMDAKIDNTIPYSPRGNRANDIQALWYGQLQAALVMAGIKNNQENITDWTRLSKKVKDNFQRDFVTDTLPYLADRLHPDGTRDFKLRPNQLYTYDLIDDPQLKRQITKAVWENLVYPWGVASLSQEDPDFHPFHEHWHYYHKDAAYHNGTVWLWNNGMAAQRLIEAGQASTAYEQLLQNMEAEILDRGAVGSLPENMDALPQEGAGYACESGTFLQAWSNAEYLRVWYEYLLGVRPKMLDNRLLLAPRLDGVVDQVKWVSQFGPSGRLMAGYQQEGERQSITYSITGAEAVEVILDLPRFAPQRFPLLNGEKLTLSWTSQELLLKQHDRKGQMIQERSVQPDQERSQRYQADQAFFQGLQTVTPKLDPGLKSLQHYHETPIDQ